MRSTGSAVVYTCSNCDAQFQKWIGRCLECGQWGTVAERAAPAQNQKSAAQAPFDATHIVPLDHAHTRQPTERILTGIEEVDRVLGGGIVPGSLTLLGGEPGIGKSTLVLQICDMLARVQAPDTQGRTVLYVSAEETAGQIGDRLKRLRLSGSAIQFLPANDLPTIQGALLHLRPTLAIIDSIQTMNAPEAAGEAGNATQIKAFTAHCLDIAKRTHIPLLLIGHVTKDGAVAGPKTLEHLVDTVLYLEGERYQSFRILRAVKNRFGSTDEIGIFEMTETGLKEVKNPSAALLEERIEHMQGSVVTCVVEGTRPLLVEIQALTNKTNFGYPVRKANGFDLNRLQMLTAVLEKRALLPLGGYDIYMNVVGGIKIDEPAADLAVCLALGSSYKNKTLGKDVAAFGEVGLGGEIRSVPHTEKRLRECIHLGLKRVIIPATSKFTGVESNLRIIKVKNIQELILQTE